MNQNAKMDDGKIRPSLVPTQIIRDISLVREYGNTKYGDSENWKTVEKIRYIDALLRHMLEFIDDPYSVDTESRIPHYKHMACNMAFLCEMLRDGDVGSKTDEIKRIRRISECACADIHSCDECICVTCRLSGDAKPFCCQPRYRSEKIDLCASHSDNN